MCRLISVIVKLWLPEGVRKTTELRRRGMAEDPRHRTDDPRHRTDDPNKVHPRTDHEGPDGVDV